MCVRLLALWKSKNLPFAHMDDEKPTNVEETGVMHLAKR